jgi:hypothetical protein
LSIKHIKKELHLKADKEQEAANGRLSCFVDVSRSGLQLLRVNKDFKAIDVVSWVFPYSSTDETWAERVKLATANEGFLDLIHGHDCKYTIAGEQVAIVPSTLFSESEKENHFDFLFGDRQAFEMKTQKFSNTDAVGLFSISKPMKAVLGESITSSFLNWVDSTLGNNSGVKAYLILEEKQFSLTILKEGRLQFSNWFQFSKADDVLYFLMATLESMNILHSDVELVLGGEIEKGDETFDVLSRFISKISFLKRPKNLTYSYSFGQLPEHRFPFIFAAACA